ncbi:MAG TPA: hypothetical protein VNT99_05735 [Methylomirabilota bacterium]|nr:hypothetical protein [Methylomirabilota bacterium]
MLGAIKLQEWIHRFELGTGARYVRWFLALAGFIAVAALYDFFCFRGMNNAEAMDAAQLGRNIGEGRGFQTFCVRPLSVSLTARHRDDRTSLLKEGHPDISNPPVYPLLLAPLLRVTPSAQDLALLKNFTVYPGDLFIAFLNQVLLGLGMLLVFRLALAWFDPTVAWISAILFVLTELYWRFSVSGLSTVLLMDVVLVLVWILSAFERGSRESAGTRRLVWLALAAGAVTAMAMLTRYSLGWLIVPVLVFVAVCATGQRIKLTGIAFLAFVVIGGPWLARNVVSSGWIFGTATYAPFADTFIFPGDTLERSILPQFRGLPGHTWTLLSALTQKTVTGTRDILITELPRLGGNWLWAFFLIGLLVRFQNVNPSRLRWFVTGTLALMVPVQALARTHLSVEAPQINSENLLVVFSPLVLVFGVGLFFVLFDSLQMPTPALRYGALAVFVIVISLPMFLAFAPPRPRTTSPPYYPPRIQQVSRYLNTNELMMSDIPWAVAWYGERQCVSVTLNWRKDFFEINDYQKTVNGLYVSTRTTDTKFFSTWFAGENRGWGAFLLQALVRREVPGGFPLRRAPEGLFTNGELLLMDRDRWSDKGGGESF